MLILLIGIRTIKDKEKKKSTPVIPQPSLSNLAWHSTKAREDVYDNLEHDPYCTTLIFFPEGAQPCTRRARGVNL
jgi:hypothetical protein